jgi:hypothetical protein
MRIFNLLRDHLVGCEAPGERVLGHADFPGEEVGCHLNSPLDLSLFLFVRKWL